MLQKVHRAPNRYIVFLQSHQRCRKPRVYHLSRWEFILFANEPVFFVSLIRGLVYIHIHANIVVTHRVMRVCVIAFLFFFLCISMRILIIRPGRIQKR